MKIIIFIIILIIICYIIIKISNKLDYYQDNNQDNNNQDNKIIVNEHYSNYLDMKTKTVNWCNKMYETGLLTEEQLNECLIPFKDIEQGILPKQFKEPQTGLSHEYSLYNNKVNKLNNNIIDDNVIMLQTLDNLTLACNDNIYMVNNINDSNIIQKDLYFTLIQKSPDTYLIKTSNNYFLSININNSNNNEYDIQLIKHNKGIDSMKTTLWKFIKINSDDIYDYFMIESLLYDKYYLIYDEDKLKIKYGNNDMITWKILINKEQINNDDNNGEDIKYYADKENILNQIKTYELTKINIKYSILLLKSLIDIIKDRFDNAYNYMNKILKEEKEKYKLSNKDYETRLNSISDNSMLDNTAKNNLVNTIPKPIGLNINNNTIDIVLTKINNTKTEYINNIQNKYIIPLENKLKDLDTNDINTHFNKYISSLNTAINETNNNIDQNNIIINRQNNTQQSISNIYNKLNINDIKMNTTNDIINSNNEMILNYHDQNTYITKLYPIIIFILLIIIIYGSYSTFNKFKVNIWYQYQT